MSSSTPTVNWGRVRHQLWGALRSDDSIALLRVLYSLCPSEDPQERQKLLYSLEFNMWNPNNRKKRGLVSIAAGNLKGVPSDGALRCLAALLAYSEVWPNELRWAKARAKQYERQKALQLLDKEARLYNVAQK